jgi:replicative DNA helicase
MIGASNDPNIQLSRFLGLPKNKLRKEGAPGDLRAEVIFKPQIARYEDVPTGE